MAAVKIHFPIAEEEIRALHVGDEVAITGRMVTGRDTAHKWMVEHHPIEIAEILQNGCIYHCGPIVKKEKSGSYTFIAAGPTTSIREEPYTPDVIGHYHVRAVIGKGGMGAGTLAACHTHGAVYLHAIGGLAAELGRCIRRVVEVRKLEFGVPEAMWVLDVEEFPAVVTMDSHQKSLHTQIEANSKQVRDRLIGVNS